LQDHWPVFFFNYIASYFDLCLSLRNPFNHAILNRRNTEFNEDTVSIYEVVRLRLGQFVWCVVLVVEDVLGDVLFNPRDWHTSEQR
jgi:hypothetical protein